MAVYAEGVSRTFGEYLLTSGPTTKQCVPPDVSLCAPLTKHAAGTQVATELNTPFVSAIMQSVSGPELAIELACNGGLSFIFGSQPIASQAEMARKVKKFKAGFVTSDSNLTPEHTLDDVLHLLRQTGHSTIRATDDGIPNRHLLGLVISRDYHPSRDPLDEKIKDFVTPLDKLIVGGVGLTLSEVNQIIWDHRLNTLPIIDKDGRLVYFVLRKDYDSYKENPNEMSSPDKKLLVGVGINTRDHQERAPALVEAGVDVFCISSSGSYSEWQCETLQWIEQQYGDKALVGAGSVVDKGGFLYLAEAGADFVKVGTGGGSICITREQEGIGHGQATALQDVARARDEYQACTGIYVPICSDGGLVHDYHMVLALIMGADFLMMGCYFARFDESSTKRLCIKNNYVKKYWGERSNRAQNWQRYDMGGTEPLKFEEGVDSHAPYAGKIKDNLAAILSRIEATMCSRDAATIPDLQQSAKIMLVLSTSIVEGGAHDVTLRGKG